VLVIRPASLRSTPMPSRRSCRCTAPAANPPLSGPATATATATATPTVTTPNGRPLHGNHLPAIPHHRNGARCSILSRTRLRRSFRGGLLCVSSPPVAPAGLIIRGCRSRPHACAGRQLILHEQMFAAGRDHHEHPRWSSTHSSRRSGARSRTGVTDLAEEVAAEYQEVPRSSALRRSKRQVSCGHQWCALHDEDAEPTPAPCDGAHRNARRVR
jgi:hypothetical protein